MFVANACLVLHCRSRRSGEPGEAATYRRGEGRQLWRRRWVRGESWHGSRMLPNRPASLSGMNFFRTFVHQICSMIVVIGSMRGGVLTIVRSRNSVPLSLLVHFVTVRYKQSIFGPRINFAEVRNLSRSCVLGHCENESSELTMPGKK